MHLQRILAVKSYFLPLVLISLFIQGTQIFSNLRSHERQSSWIGGKINKSLKRRLLSYAADNNFVCFEKRKRNHNW